MVGFIQDRDQEIAPTKSRSQRIALGAPTGDHLQGAHMHCCGPAQQHFRLRNCCPIEAKPAILEGVPFLLSSIECLNAQDQTDTGPNRSEKL